MKKVLLILFFLSLSLYGYTQCTATITASGSAICSGNPVVLTANPSGGGPYNYSWSTGETTQTITVNKTGTYTVTIQNGANCTSAPVSQVITEANIPDPPSVPSSNVNACPGTTTTLTVTGPGGTYQWYDEGGAFKGSGPSFVTDIINARTVYYVETTMNGCTSGRTPITVFPIGGPIGTGAITCPGGTVTLTATGAGSYEWYNAPSGGTRVGTGPSFTTPPLSATTTYYVVGITQGCASVPTAVQATVNPAPVAPTFIAPAVCAGQTTNLHADSSTPNATFNWYTVPTGGTPFISSADYTTGILNAPVTYYVEAVSPEGCIGPRIAVPVPVNPIPAAPTAQQVGVACSGGTATLTATAPGGTYTWYDTETSLFPLYTGDTFVTPVLNASRSYYVQVTSAAGCPSATRTMVNVTVNPTPPAPLISGQTICSGNSATLTPTGPGGTYEWYDAATAGNLLFSGTAGFTTPVLNATTTYYVQATINGCTSTTRTAVTVTVNTTPPLPVSGGDQTICMGQSATLTATGTGSSFEWYDAMTGGNLVASTQNFNTPALSANTTYYVQSSNGLCSSARVAVNITVTALPPSPTANGTTICAGTSATLTATGGPGVFNWYNSATGGTLLFTGANYTTPNLATTTTYHVALANGGCSSVRTAVTVNVTSVLNQFHYASGTYCKGAPNPSPVITVPGGTFSGSAGLVINPTTGEIDLVASLVGTRTVTYTNGCVIFSRQISIVLIPDAGFSYGAAAYCRGSADVSATFTATSSGGNFTATPAGLVFLDDNRGVIDMTASAPGNYTITNTINIPGCATATAQTTLRIDPQVVVNAGPDQGLATGANAQLAGSVTGGATAGTWSGGTGTFNNANALNAIYTPGAGETSATLTLTSANPGTTCGAVSDQVIITFSPQPAQPTVSPVAAICAGSNATLTATGPGGTYRWYDANTGGNLLFTGASYATLPLSTTTTFYVSTTMGGIASNRTTVVVTVNPVPIAPTVAPVAPICAGNAATLIASGPTGTYQWFTVPIGGTVQFTGGTYTTSPLTTNTSFYVQVVENGCIGPRTQADVVVNPVPRETSATVGNICSGVAQNYIMTADLPGTTFRWSRAAVTDISNPAVTNQVGGSITEALINTGGSTRVVTYVIIPTLNGCDGVPFNYRVTVYPTSRVISANTTTACSGRPINYSIDLNTAGQFTWARLAHPNILQTAVSGQTSKTIGEALTNTSNTPVNVTYIISHKTSTCDGGDFTLTVTINPRVTLDLSQKGQACSGVAQNFVISSRSNVPGAMYSWSRAAKTGIREAAVSNNTSGVIDEVLTNTTNLPVEVEYTITTIANGCQLTPSTYKVTVEPIVATPIANAYSPVCEGNPLRLFNGRSYPVGATYSWVGPNGYTSTQENPVIANAAAANAGRYTLTVTYNGCSSQSAFKDVLVTTPSLANAGGDTTVCPVVVPIRITGTVTGGGTTGVWAIASGNGSLGSAPNQLNNTYIPNAADITAGSVRLTLTSTSTSDCAPSVDELLITFGTVPAADAGTDRSVCPQFPVALNGRILIPMNGIWTTSGTGAFYYGGSPNSTQLNGMPSPEYRPSAADIAAGSVKLTLTANTTDACYTADEVTITFTPPPTVNAGGTRFVAEGKTIVLEPTVSDDNVTYSWTLPDGSTATGLSPANVKQPTVTGITDITYRLTVTDSRGCTNYSDVLVKVAIEVVAPNTFTPNNDGVNDVWDVRGLIAYEDARVDIFNRYGQKVYTGIGYSKPWDGTQNGKPLPAGTYYYIIDTRMLGMKYSGYVAVIR